MRAGSRPGALLLSLSLAACAATQHEPPQTGATGAVVEKDKPDAAATAGPPRWDSSRGVKQLWAQVAPLGDTGLLCPFVVHKDDATAPYLTVRYESGTVHSPGHSLHLLFHPAPGAVAGWGIGCLRHYDVNPYIYAVFFAKGAPGTRFFFRLKDGAEVEGSYEVTLKGEGWERVVVPLSQFAAVNLKTLISVSFGFTEAQGEADLYLDDLEFTRSLP